MNEHRSCAPLLTREAFEKKAEGMRKLKELAKEERERGNHESAALMEERIEGIEAWERYVLSDGHMTRTT